MNKIIYLDAAASALKPEIVIKAEKEFLQNDYANAGRGICSRAAAVDKSLLDVRKKACDFINADSPSQIIFTSGSTDGLNRIVNILNASNKIKEGAVVAVSDLDHHSARLPWVAFKEKNINVVISPLDDNWNFDLALIPTADIMVITAMSNVLGMPIDVKAVIDAARKKNPDVITIVDAAQYVVHQEINAKDWGADFICFSGHKIGADTGVGVMYIKNPDDFYPDKFGGGMVNKILNENDFNLNAAPDKFEAGTLPITQIIGMGKAIDYLKNNRPNLNFIKYMYDELSKNSKIKILTSRDSTLLTFTVKDMHVLDFGALIGAHNVCLRVGNMCAGWIHNALGVSGSIRISVGPWNTMDEMRDVVNIINKIVK